MALKNIGSLWIANGKSRAAFTGYLDGPNRTKGPKIFVFPNEKATPENRQPQYRLVADDGEETRPTEKRPPSDDFSVSDEDVPFVVVLPLLLALGGLIA